MIGRKRYKLLVVTVAQVVAVAAYLEWSHDLDRPGLNWHASNVRLRWLLPGAVQRFCWVAGSREQAGSVVLWREEKLGQASPAARLFSFY